ncbi:MAG: tetratricopeptide repeat protein [Chloroflexi bacterium]|nr:tetratricopeptide repeat protein [Chloroflexota bacterium]OJV90619.1 MAG: hypothetical protein BGO39_19615 [Chloroflexi bacterium 54-19]
MTPDIQITTLGEVSLNLSGQVKPPSITRKAEALLIYLICNKQAYSREVLADLFWENDEPGAALNSLRVALTQLRPMLKDHLIATHHQIGIRPSASISLDIQLMQEHLEKSRSLPRNHAQTEALAELAAAVELYKGPFFAGWYLRNCPRFEQWQFAQQQLFEQMIFGALQELVESYLELGNYVPALKYARRWLDLDPFNEEAHRQYMRLLYISGQRQNALDFYRWCKKLLQEELQVEPSQATKVLYHQIRDGKSLPGKAPATGLSREVEEPVQIPKNSPNTPLSTNFPYPLTSMVGRKIEMERIRELLSQPSVRLLTLTGVGGSGKTRLATELAMELSRDSQFKDGIIFVPLASFHSPDELILCMVQALSLNIDPQLSLLENLKDYLRNRYQLLILDNFEQILVAAPIVADLLKSSPGLKILVTSREHLNLYGEQLYPVKPLALPKKDEQILPPQLLKNPSIQLLTDRIKALDPDFELTVENAPTIIQICIRLEGLPLAIELAAAASRTTSLEDLMTRLDRRMKVLVGGPVDADERQQAIKSTITWSYQPLKPELQQVFRFMSVVADSLDEKAACVIFNLDISPEFSENKPGQNDAFTGTVSSGKIVEWLNLLVTKNLLMLQRNPDGQKRFGILKTLAEYGFEQLLINGEAFELQKRHATYFAGLAESASTNLSGSEAQNAVKRLGQNYAEILNALHWAEENDLDITIRLAKSLTAYWEIQGYHQQAHHYLEDLLKRSKDWEIDQSMQILDLLTSITWKQGDYQTTLKFYQQLLDYKEAQNDQEGIAEIKFRFSVLVFQKGEMSLGEKLVEESLAIFSRLGNQLGLAKCYNGLAALASEKGQFEKAFFYHNKCLEIYRKLDDESGTITALTNLGTIASRQQKFALARSYYQESLLLLEKLNRPLERAITFNNLGLLAVSEEDYAQADQYYKQAQQVFEEIGHLYGQCNILIDRALAAYHLGQIAAGLQFLETAFKIATRMDNIYLSIYGLAEMSFLVGSSGHHSEAVLLGEGALHLASEHGFVIEHLYLNPLDQSLESARRALGESVYSQLSEEAKGLTLVRLVELALTFCRG